MVFSSIQAYLDSSNWQQPPPSSYQVTGVAAARGGGGGAHLVSPRPQPPQQPQPQHQQPQQTASHGTGPGSIRPGSMADRARMANISMPEAALKCPRCESTNTKFCYFNNYSLTQPRHFCKNCRRYWTRGGALRNVPVGGGCRRNRRTKSSNNNNNGGSSNTTMTAAAAAGAPDSTMEGINSSNYGGGGHHESILSQLLSPARLIMSPTFNHLNDLSAAASSSNTAADRMGLLNYGVASGLSTQDLSSIHMGNSAAAGGVGGGSLLSCLEQWRPSQPPWLPQFPALGGGNLEDSSNSSSGFYPFEASKADESGYVRPPKISSSISSALATQLASVKVEDNPYKWGTNGTFSPWMDLSSFGSSG